MNENLKKLWFEHQAAAEKSGNERKATAVVPCLFLLPPAITDERISKLSENTDKIDDILNDVEGYPIFFLPLKTPKNFSAYILFLRNERSEKLFNTAIKKIEEENSQYPGDARILQKALDEPGDFYVIPKTALERLYKAVQAIKNNTAYNGVYGYKTGNDTPTTANTIILNDQYEIVVNEDNTVKTAGILKGAPAKEQALSQTSNSANFISEDMEKIKKLLEKNYQVILTGAPGTGKTFLAKQIAYQITGDNKNTPEEQSHINFVQFHPSLDYTDFVEGLRPVPPHDESGTIGFERKDGIFKSFCKKALKNYLDSEKSAQEIESEENAQERINSFLNDAIENQKIFTTTNKNSFYIDRFDDDNIYIKVPGNEIKKDVTVPYGELQKVVADNLTLNKPGNVKTVFNRIHNRQHDSYLYVLYQELIKTKGSNSVLPRKTVGLQKFVFIIDEINRGDISKIFGELFYAIDPGYRGSTGKVKTQYHNLLKETNDLYKDGFYIPSNVYIIGTMNDIDRSVESMDFAIRRRFTWKEIKAEDRISMWDGKIDRWKGEAQKRMTALNKVISQTDSLGEAFHIGPAYFLKLNEYDGNFNDLWDLHIQPLLKEYLRGTPNINNAIKLLADAYNSPLQASKEQNSELPETVAGAEE